MKAMMVDAYGPPDSMTLRELPSPEPKKGEVLIRVRAAGVNFFDILIIAGTYQFKPPFPFGPGSEVAGDVIAVGDGVSNVKPGDRVMAMVANDGYATEAIAPAAGCLPIPEGMTYEQAAGFPIVYGTSHVGLEHRANLKAGETLLVHGAAGGVGLTAVEIGKIMGATVIATASTDEKLEVCKQHGADHVINYSSGEFKDQVKELTGGNGADVIYDPVGGDVLLQSLRCINWEGRLLVIGFASGTIPDIPANLALIKNCAIVGHFWGAYRMRDPKVIVDSFTKLLGWFAEGKINPHVSMTFPLEDAAQALHALQERKATGKIVITMPD